MSLRTRNKNAPQAVQDERGKPPSDIPKSEIARRMLSVEQPYELVEYMPTAAESYQLRIEVLTMQQLSACQRAAYEDLKAANITIATHGETVYAQELADAKAIQVLWRAIRDPEPRTLNDGRVIYSPVFFSPEQIRESLTADQVTKLFNLYEEVRNRAGDNEYALYVEENFDAWCESIATGVMDPDLFLAQLPLPILTDLVAQLAKAHWHYTHPDSPPNASPNGSESESQTSASGIGSHSAPSNDGGEKQLSKSEAAKAARAEKRRRRKAKAKQAEPTEQPNVQPIDKQAAAELIERMKNG